MAGEKGIVFDSQPMLDAWSQLAPTARNALLRDISSARLCGKGVKGSLRICWSRSIGQRCPSKHAVSCWFASRACGVRLREPWHLRRRRSTSGRRRHLTIGGLTCSILPLFSLRLTLSSGQPGLRTTSVHSNGLDLRGPSFGWLACAYSRDWMSLVPAKRCWPSFEMSARTSVYYRISPLHALRGRDWPDQNLKWVYLVAISASLSKAAQSLDDESIPELDRQSAVISLMDTLQDIAGELNQPDDFVPCFGGFDRKLAMDAAARWAKWIKENDPGAGRLLLRASPPPQNPSP